MNSISLNIKTGLSIELKPIPFADENYFSSKIEKKTVRLSFHFSGIDCSSKLEKVNSSYWIELNFEEKYLQNFTDEMDFNTAQFPTITKQDVCCNTQMILHEMVNNKWQDAFKKMFFESKALELLLCFQKNNAVAFADCSVCKFLTNPIEKEKILKAKELLLNNLDNPPTIVDLAHQIGINQCYLKRGFKEVFNSTIYEFVQEQRIQKAKLLLTSNQYSVAQVAEEVGFASSSNFSSVFKKHTGIFPSEFQRN